MKIVALFIALVLAVLGIGLPAYADEREFAQADCHLDSGPCVKTVGEFTVAFDINPKPLKTMHELTFTASVSQHGRPTTDATLTIDLTMPGMFMGKHVISLADHNGGTYEGHGIIVRCPGGKKVWQATVLIERDGKESAVNFVFEAP